MPLGLFGILILWLVTGSIKEKVYAFFKNKNAMLIGSVYILTLLGLIHTENFGFAIDDVRRKIPLFFLPFFFSGFSPLSKKELYLILKIYVAGVVIATLWSLFVFVGGLGVNILNVRNLSRFNSHIRFGLEVSLALFFTFFFFIKSQGTKQKIIWGSLGCWFIFSLFVFSLFSGVIVWLATTLVLLIVFGLLIKRTKLKLLLLSFLALLFIGLFVFINTSIKKFYLAKKVDEIKEIPFTKAGDRYHKDAKTDNSTLKENGYYVAKNIAYGELAAAWNAKKTIIFEGEDLKGQKIKNTLIRFITSKGLRKDKEGVQSLTKEEVNAIENGIPNVKYLNMNYFSIRLHKIIWEYDSYINSRDINGHSVLMRWEYWRTALKIIKKNILFGVGTGDVQDSFYQQYEIDSSPLEQKYRLRTHNQYLTYWVSFGVIGFVWFLTCLFYPIIKTKLYKNYLYLSFFSIALLSMTTEDTLETQVGINFFVFFNTLFLLSLNFEKK